MRSILASFLLLATIVLAQDRPNIVIYLSDDLGLLDTSVYGSKSVRTPNLERLASTGMTLDNAFIASPACAPSRAALLTGLMPARNGAEANHTYPKPGTPYLTTALKSLGYEIAVFGKIAHGDDKPEYEFDYYSKPRVNLARNVAAYFAKRTSGAPLCLMAGDRRPHVPWTKDSIYKPAEADLPSYFIDTRETREHRARYYSDITGLDTEMRKVRDLAAKELGDNIIYLFSSDHGGQWPFGKWNLYDAGIRVPLIMAWQGRIKPNTRSSAMVSWIDVLPTIIELAGGKVPSGIDGKSFAGVLMGKTQQHRSEIYTTHSGDGIMNVYPIRGIRTDRYKYIMNLLPDCYHSNHSDILRKDGAGAYWDSWNEAEKSDPKAAAIVKRYYQRPAEELYDLQNDPDEQTNLAADPAQKTRLKALREKLESWMKAQGDKKTVFKTPYPLSGPRPNPGSAGGRAGSNGRRPLALAPNTPEGNPPSSKPAAP